MRLRNRRYDRGRAEVHRVGVPVISVGNLSLGGTGKTPLVEWIARYYGEQGLRVGLVSRGYGAGEDGMNDEALELQLALPGVPHQQNRDRVAAARAVVEQHDSQRIILDDGFQHRRLGRDLDIVLLDATEPFGYEHVFPRGTLREPLAGLARADVVILSRADMLDEEARKEVRRRVLQLAPDAVWCEVVHGASGLVNSAGETLSLDLLSRERVGAFCGIGNPAGFRHTLESLGCELVAWREFPDHYRYTPEDLESLTRWAAEADLVLCTRKDLVKLRDVAMGDVPVWALGIELRFLVGEEALKCKLGAVTGGC
ncbi:MAG: tetraacyldisaccharide 4'-kinase [Planctomycetes bacterium]|nr:tetraacyldisaccharide 4'-kinase [Planctomycetota bacterium]